MSTHHRIIIVGAGISGIGMAVKLRREGIEDFVLLERNEALGGTWFEHTYPGFASDYRRRTRRFDAENYEIAAA